MSKVLNKFHENNMLFLTHDSIKKEAQKLIRKINITAKNIIPSGNLGTLIRVPSTLGLI